MDDTEFRKKMDMAMAKLEQVLIDHQAEPTQVLQHVIEELYAVHCKCEMETNHKILDSIDVDISTIVVEIKVLKNYLERLKGK